MHDSGYLCEAAQTLFTKHLMGFFTPPSADSPGGGKDYPPVSSYLSLSKIKSTKQVGSQALSVGAALIEFDPCRLKFKQIISSWV